MTSNLVPHTAQEIANELRIVATFPSYAGVRSLMGRAAEALEALSTPDETSSVITPLEQLLVEWWSTDMENAELFNRAVRLSPALAAAMNALPEKSE